MTWWCYAFCNDNKLPQTVQFMTLNHLLPNSPTRGYTNGFTESNTTWSSGLLVKNVHPMTLIDRIGRRSVRHTQHLMEGCQFCKNESSSGRLYPASSCVHAYAQRPWRQQRREPVKYDLQICNDCGNPSCRLTAMLFTYFPDHIDWKVNKLLLMA